MGNLFEEIGKAFAAAQEESAALDEDTKNVCVSCAKLKKCQEAMKLFNDAKKTLGKDPVIKHGPLKNTAGSDAETDPVTHDITLDPKLAFDRCKEVQAAVFELTNVTGGTDHAKADAKLTSGGYGTGAKAREAYIRDKEKIEYDGVQKVLKIFDTCAKIWNCKGSDLDFARGKDFESYYKQLDPSHKENYGQYFDQVQAARAGGT